MSPILAAYLKDLNVPHHAILHEPLRTVDDAVRIMPHDTGRMVKCLAFARPDNSVAIVALLAQSKADYGAVALAIGVSRKLVQLAPPTLVKEVLDMEAGAVSPIGLGVSTVHIDPGVMSLQTVLVGSGRVDCTLEVAPLDLIRLPLTSLARVSRL